jgi:hypothetical protein
VNVTQSGQFQVTVDGGVLVAGNDVISAANSSTTPLGGGAAFTGSYVSVMGYAAVVITIASNQNSATNGVVVNFSTDGIHADDTEEWTFATAGGSEGWATPARAEYVQVVYTNGASAQGSFRLQTILKVAPPTGGITDIEQEIPVGAHAQTVRGMLFGRTAGGSLSVADTTVKAGSAAAAAGDTALVVSENPISSLTGQLCTEVCCGTSPTALPASPLTGRAGEVIQNQGPLPIYIGGSGVQANATGSCSPAESSTLRRAGA